MGLIGDCRAISRLRARMRWSLRRSWRWWPFVHWPLLLLIPPLCVWRYHYGYFVLQPNPRWIIGDIDRVDRWTYFGWWDHPDQGPALPNVFWQQLLNGEARYSGWHNTFQSTRFAMRLAERGVISKATHDFELARDAYPLLTSLLRPGHARGSPSWGEGLLMEYTSSDGARRIASVWHEHLPRDGVNVTARITVYQLDSIWTLRSNREWVIRFAMFDEAESVLWWWIYLLAVFAAPIWMVMVIRAAIRYQIREGREARKECLNCGYSKVGLAIDRCPECGHAETGSSVTPT